MSTGREILSDFFEEEHTVFIKIGQFFQVVIYFHSGHLLPKISINTDFFPLVG